MKLFTRLNGQKREASKQVQIQVLRKEELHQIEGGKYGGIVKS